MRRSQQASAADRIRFGRGTDNEVPLADIRVELSAAVAVAARRRAGDRERSAPRRCGSTAHSVDNAPVAGRRDPDRPVPDIGSPTRREGCDAALSIELVQPLGDTLDRLMSGSRIGLATRRAEQARDVVDRLSWSSPSLLLIAPIVVYSRGLVPHWKERAEAGPAAITALSWNAGTLSNAHRLSRPTARPATRRRLPRVRDTACLSCHANGRRPCRGRGRFGADACTNSTTRRCTDCHEEHRGLRGLRDPRGDRCASTATATSRRQRRPPSSQMSAGSPTGHPQFRATLVADPMKRELVRRELGTTPAPQDRPGFKFSHVAHLRQGRLADARLQGDGLCQLSCAPSRAARASCRSRIQTSANAATP